MRLYNLSAIKVLRQDKQYGAEILF